MRLVRIVCSVVTSVQDSVASSICANNPDSQTDLSTTHELRFVVGNESHYLNIK